MCAECSSAKGQFWRKQETHLVNVKLQFPFEADGGVGHVPQFPGVTIVNHRGLKSDDFKQGVRQRAVGEQEVRLAENKTDLRRVEVEAGEIHGTTLGVVWVWSEVHGARDIAQQFPEQTHSSVVPHGEATVEQGHVVVVEATGAFLIGQVNVPQIHYKCNKGATLFSRRRKIWFGPVHIGRGTPCNMGTQIMEHIVVNRSVHTAGKQHQRVCTQICMQMCLRVLCERALTEFLVKYMDANMFFTSTWSLHDVYGHIQVRNVRPVLHEGFEPQSLVLPV